MGKLGPVAEEQNVELTGADDGALLRRAAEGSPQASAALVDAHWPAIYRVALLILRDHTAAEDVAQETILTALDRSSTFEDSRPLRPWLVRIGTNKALDIARQRRRRPEQSLEGISEHASASTDEFGGLRARLEALDAETRALVVLRYVFDYRSNEIGEIVGMSAGAVRTRLSRALSSMRIEIEKEEHDASE